MKKFNLDLGGKIAFAFFLVTFTVFYVSLYVMDNELRYFEHSHNTPATFTQGEVLTPDYVHTDTLIVTNATLLNKIFADQDPATDGEINTALSQTTAKK